MNESHLQRFYTLLETHVGISLDHTKQYLLESRLSPIIRGEGFENLQELIRHLNQTTVGAIHWQAFDALTTNETMFFRDKHVFDALKHKIIPSLLEAKRKEKTLRIWCAAVSTGQEAYSMAILIKEYFPELEGWDVQIHATDISARTLQKAKEAVYSSTEVNRGLDAHLIKKYCQKQINEQFVLQYSIRDMVTFKNMNLIDPWPLTPKYDLVLLRNVMIYFKQDTKDHVLRKICAQMYPNQSVLILGAAESIHTNPLYRLVQLDKMSHYVAF